MAEVARAAGVSVMTVSYTYSQPGRVSEQAAARVRSAAAELGYPGPHPGARSLRQRRSGSLGVVLGEHLGYAFEDPQAARFLSGVARVCGEYGVGMTLVPVTGEDSDVERVAAAVVDGFIVWTTTDDDPVVDAVTASKLPAVIHGGPARPGLPAVSIDNHAAARAVGAEAFTGARRPAVLSFPFDHDRRRTLVAGPNPADALFPVTRHRLEGYRRAWLDRGGSWDEVLVAVAPRNTAELGEQLTDELLTEEAPPDSIAAMSDELAIGALHAMERARISVPVDLAVTGWDDTDAAGPAGLTTVAQSLHDQGARCARMALGERVSGGRRRAPAWSVVRRGSTRAA